MILLAATKLLLGGRIPVQSATTKAGPKTTGPDGSDSDALSNDEAEEEVPRTKLISLVLDVRSSACDSGRVVNMETAALVPKLPSR